MELKFPTRFVLKKGMIANMKKNNENGFAVTDIAISLVVVFMFASLISILVYNFNSNIQEINLKSEALQLAIQEIENMKTKTIEDLETENTSYRNLSEIAGEQGFWREIIVKDYAENNPGATSGLVKKVTVRVQYKFKKETESVELSTIISKEI